MYMDLILGPAALRLSACILDIALVGCNNVFISAEAILCMHKTCCCTMLLHCFEIAMRSK